MYNTDKVVEHALNNSQEFRLLYDEHIKFEQDLEALYSLKYIPPVVEMRIKEIKVNKLKGKDRMQQILSEYAIQELD